MTHPHQDPAAYERSGAEVVLCQVDGGGLDDSQARSSPRRQLLWHT